MGLLLLYLFTALGISFLCSILEAVLLSIPMSFVTMLEQEGRPGAALLKKYKQNIDKPISAILSLNTIAHTVGAAGVGAQSEMIFGSEFFALTSAILTLLILVVSEIIPKTIGAACWRSLAIPSAHIIHILVFITYPLVLISEVITHIFSPKKHQASVSREEVSAMVTVGAEEGVLEKKENRMIQNLLKLDDVKARDIMTPSSVVEMAEENMTLKEFYRNEAFRTYSRIPIYNDENDDYIKGYVLRQYIQEAIEQLLLSVLNTLGGFLVHVVAEPMGAVGREHLHVTSEGLPHEAIVGIFYLLAHLLVDEQCLVHLLGGERDDRMVHQVFSKLDDRAGIEINEIVVAGEGDERDTQVGGVADTFANGALRDGHHMAGCQLIFLQVDSETHGTFHTKEQRGEVDFEGEKGYMVRLSLLGTRKRVEQ